MSSAKYPEHEKLRAVKAQSQTIGDFLSWLEERDMAVCERVPEDIDEDGFSSDEEFVPTQKGIERLLAEYFEIDLRKISDEKDAMIAELHKAAGLPRHEEES